jgi:hypothetical protein
MSAQGAKQYLQEAEECRRNAEAAVDHDVKDRWVWLADHWEALAKSSEMYREYRLSR